MKVLPISQKQNKPPFGLKFKLSKETVNSVEKSTGLTYEEMTNSSFDESEKLMKKRGTLKEPNKIFLWLQNTYKKFGEKTGLLEREHKFYTHVD